MRRDLYRVGSALSIPMEDADGLDQQQSVNSVKVLPS